MAEEADYLLGFVQKSHGIKGELLVSLTSPDIEFEKRIETIWLGDNSDHLHPWNVESFHLRGSSAFLKLNDVNSREEADYLKGIKIFVPKSSISRGNPIQLIGFKVKELKTHSLLGEIVDIDLNSAQQRLIIETNDGELTVPFVDEFIHSIDFDEQVVEVTVMDGMEL